MLVERETS